MPSEAAREEPHANPRRVRAAIPLLIFMLSHSPGAACDLPTYYATIEQMKAQEAEAASKNVDSRRELVLWHDPSLTGSMFAMARAFEQSCPGVRVRREAMEGRVAARRAAEQGQSADIVAVDDYQTIQRELMPAHASWFVCLARDEMVLAYTPHSKFQAEVALDNWFEVLCRPGVTLAATDPATDPTGYRTRLVWQLADRHYLRRVDGKTIEQALLDRLQPGNIRATLPDALPLLLGNTVDYLFIPRTVATQFSQPHLRLRPELNLGSSAYAEFYAKARLELPPARPEVPPVVHVGRPMTVAFTIPTGAPDRAAARRFADLLVGEVGFSVLDSQGLIPLRGGLVGFSESSVPRLPRE